MDQNRYTLFVLLAFLGVSKSQAQCPITVNAGEDIYICPPISPVQLQGDISGAVSHLTWDRIAKLTFEDLSLITAN